MDPRARNAIGLLVVGAAITVGIAFALKSPSTPSAAPGAASSSTADPGASQAPLPPIRILNSTSASASAEAVPSLTVDPSHVDTPLPPLVIAGCPPGLSPFETTGTDGTSLRGCGVVDPKTKQVVPEGAWRYTLEGGGVTAGDYAHGKKVGTWTTWSPAGNVTKIEPYVDGNLNGVVVEWNDAGQRIDERTYRDGVLDGPVTYTRQDGTVVHELWKDGRFVPSSP